MQLIGMLDSPYVRRVAISLEYLQVPFRHKSVSVFRTFAEFQSINPVVKAPSLVCDDGEVLMDSSLILQFVEATMSHSGSLWSQSPETMQHEMRAVSLALAACEKSVQIVYERNLRPASAQFEPWMERVQNQLLAAYAGLEHEVALHKSIFEVPRNQATITTAVAWQFTQATLAAAVPAQNHPNLATLSARVEKELEFIKYRPIVTGV